MTGTPMSAPAQTHFEIWGFVPGSDILAHLGQRPWFDQAGNSPIVARLKGGDVATFALEPDSKHTARYQIRITFTPDPERPGWVVNADIACFSMPNIIERIIAGWESGRGGIQKAAGLRFPGLHRMNDHIERASGGEAWGRCEVIITDIGDDASKWSEITSPTPPTGGDPKTPKRNGGTDPH